MNREIVRSQTNVLGTVPEVYPQQLVGGDIVTVKTDGLFPSLREERIDCSMDVSTCPVRKGENGAICGVPNYTINTGGEIPLFERRPETVVWCGRSPGGIQAEQE